MGTLSFPPQSTVLLDANAVIYAVERVVPYWTHLRPLFEAAAAGQLRLLSSELVLAEALPMPLRSDNQALVSLFEGVFATDVTLRPIIAAVLRQAAKLRAQYRLKTPDAIYAATAISERCDALVTNDADLSRVSSIDVRILHRLDLP